MPTVVETLSSDEATGLALVILVGPKYAIESLDKEGRKYYKQYRNLGVARAAYRHAITAKRSQN